MQIRKWVLGGVSLFHLCVATATSHIGQLENGLSYLLLPDDRVPLASVQIWYDVGGRLEPEGLTGISHYLEHMMFQGSENYPGKQYTKIVDQLGARYNAFTTQNETVYYADVPANEIETVLALEGDRLFALTFDQAIFDNEKQVILEERRMRVDDSPIGLLFEQLYAHAFVTGPQHAPVVGWESDLEKLTLPDVMEWYAKYYKPARAQVVIAGDLDIEQTVQWIETHFGHWHNIEMLTQSIDYPVGYDVEKHIDIAYPKTESPHVLMGFRVPSLKTNPDDAVALWVLTHVLDGGKSTWFERELVRNKALVTHGGMMYDPWSHDDTLFLSYGFLKTDVTPEEFSELIKTKLTNLSEYSSSEHILKRGKALLKSDLIFSQDTLSERAIVSAKLNRYLGQQLELSDLLDKIDSVSLADIKNVCEKYLTADQLTTVALLPENVEG